MTNPAIPDDGGSPRVTRFGSLDVTLLPTKTGVTSEYLVVLCHGFGAPGTDLVPIGEALRSIVPGGGKVAFAFPAAPQDLAEQGMPGARAWWMLDIDRIQRAAESGQIRDLSGEQPPELPGVSEQLGTCVEEMLASLGLTGENLILGGFSQGAMLATDVAMHRDVGPADLWVLSGSLLWQSRLEDHMRSGGSFPVFISHGTADPVLPFSGSNLLGEFLAERGFDVDRLSFPGGHGIPQPVLVQLAERLAEHLTG